MKYVEVFWTPYYNKTLPHEIDNNLVITKPKPFFPMLLDARSGMPYMQCPAVAKKHQNDFVVCAPYDFVISFIEEQKQINTDRYGQRFFETSITANWATLPKEMPPLIQAPPRYLMYSFEDVEIEVTDLPIIQSEFSKNVKMVHGSFNISKWYRPIEAAFEVIDASKPVVIEAGKPMYLIRLRTPNNVPVKLTRVDFTDDLSTKVGACMAVKDKRKGLKLQELYDLAAEYLNVFKEKYQRK